MTTLILLAGIENSNCPLFPLLDLVCIRVEKGIILYLFEKNWCGFPKLESKYIYLRQKLVSYTLAHELQTKIGNKEVKFYI